MRCARACPRASAGALRAARSWRGAATLAVVAAYPVGPLTPVQLAAALAGMPFLVFLLSVPAGGDAPRGALRVVRELAARGRGRAPRPAPCSGGALRRRCPSCTRRFARDSVLSLAVQPRSPRTRLFGPDGRLTRESWVALPAQRARERVERGVDLARLEARDDRPLDRAVVRTHGRACAARPRRAGAERPDRARAAGAPGARDARGEEEPRVDVRSAGSSGRRRRRGARRARARRRWLKL